MEKKYKNKKEVRKIRWLLFGVALSLFASDVIYQAAVSFMSNPPHDYVRTAVVEIAAFALPFLIYGFSRTEKFSSSDLRLSPFEAKKGIYVVLLGISGQFVMMLLNLPIEYFFQKVLQIGCSGGYYVPKSLSTVLGGIVSVCIIPAIMEELCMRGLVFSTYNKLGTKTAYLFTVVIFALFHGKPEELLGYIFMGAMAVFVMLRCNSLYAAVIYHTVSNLTAMCFSLAAFKIVSHIWLLFGFMGILFVVAFLKFYMSFSPEGTVKGKREKRVFFKSLFSPPIILSIGVVVLRYWLLNIRN